MANQLDKTKPVPDEIKRLTRHRLETAREVIKPRGKPSATAVHTARKQLKEARAALRLVRQEIGKGFDSNNQLMRDAGRQLSELRDAAVLLDTLKDVLTKAKIAPSHFAGLRAKLRKQKLHFEHRYRPSAFHKKLRTVDRNLPDLNFKHDGWGAIGPSLLRTYRHGRRAMHEASHQQSDDAWHEWRKRAKDLRHQFEMLTPVWPAVFEKIAKQAHALGDLLGTDHDLAVLRQVLLDESDETIPAKWRDKLIDAIDEQRQMLQRDAKKLGDLLYAEPPAAFVKRMKEYWHSA